MDELMNSVNLIEVSEERSFTSSRLGLYKKRFDVKSNQEERRRQILLEQKKKRQDVVEAKRAPDKSTSPKSRGTNAKYKKTNPDYIDKLMFSEWFEQVPYDLFESWILTVCPVGKRCLVVAHQGDTFVYNKAGKLITKHYSRLPGGYKDSKSDETVLDCIYCDTLRTYFVLDCISWKSHPVVDSETQFRFYWLACKLNETPELSQRSYDNPYIFRDVPRASDLTEIKIQDIFINPFEFRVDGVLFYHKETHYTSGFTPLVGWLKDYMLPEILGIQMPDWVMKTAPSDYLNARHSIDEFNKIEIEKLTRIQQIKELPNTDCELQEDDQTEQ